MLASSTFYDLKRYMIKQIIIHGAQISINFMLVGGCKNHVMEKMSKEMI